MLSAAAATAATAAATVHLQFELCRGVQVGQDLHAYPGHETRTSSHSQGHIIRHVDDIWTGSAREPEALANEPLSLSKFVSSSAVRSASPSHSLGHGRVAFASSAKPWDLTKFSTYPRWPRLKAPSRTSSSIPK